MSYKYILNIVTMLSTGVLNERTDKDKWYRKHNQKVRHAQTCKQKMHLQLQEANLSQTQPANSISRITSLALTVSISVSLLRHSPPTSLALSLVTIKT